MDRSKLTYAEAAEQANARIRGQEKALLDAIADGEPSVAELMVAVRRHRDWRHLGGDRLKFRQHIVNRLDTLSAQGKVTNHYHHVGPINLTPIRTVRRAPDDRKLARRTEALPH
jgi:hypothetical protein